MTTSNTSQFQVNRRSVRSYTAALKQAGVGKDELQLLRELAELNAGELSHPSDHVPPSRLLLKGAAF